MGTHWVSLFVKSNKVIYFDSFAVEYVPKEINKFTHLKNQALSLVIMIRQSRVL